MAFISFGKVDKNIIPIIVGSVFCFLNRILNKYDKTILFSHIIITNIIITISRLFTVIPFIILIIRSKKVCSFDIQTKYTNTTFESSRVVEKTKKIKNKLWFVLLSAVLYFVQATLFIYTIDMQTNYWIWEILFTAIFYYLLFHIKLYRHHYLCIALIILMGLSIDLTLGNIQKDISINISKFILRFIREILFCFHDIIDKYVMEKKYGLVYEISLSNGIICTFLFLIFAILDYYFFKFDDFQSYFDNFNGTEFLVAIGVLITQLGLYLGVLFTAKNNTPCHVFIIFVFGQLAHYIDFSSKSIIILICFIFILFLSLIFNEIIELNFCGLSDNIKRNISKRAEAENFNIEETDIIDTNDANYMIHLKDKDSEDVKSES